MSQSIVTSDEEPRAPKAEERTPEQWAEKHGMIAPPAPDGSRYRAAHQAADVAHGWSVHAYHWGPFTLTESDYLASVAAAGTGKRHGPANRRSR